MQTRLVNKPNTQSVSIQIKGLFATLTALQTAYPNGDVNAYSVGTAANNSVYIWDEYARTWTSIGSLMGQQGQPGPQGPPGPSGVANATTYTHNQIAASSSWVVNHNLNGYPSVIVIDSGGTTVIGDITYNTRNKLTLDFTAAFSGTAECNN